MSDNSIASAVCSKTHVVLALGLVGSCAILGISWLDGRHTQTRLQATIDSANKTLSTAASQESARGEQLKIVLAQIAELKAKVKTPAQALAALPSALPKLPEPIEIQSASAPESSLARAGVAAGLVGSTATSTRTSVPTTVPDSPSSVAPATSTSAFPGSAVVKIPQADLKPLFDAAEDCKACQTKLSTAQADLADSKTQLAAALAQRDAALKAAKGGSLWARTKRAAKWLMIGALCGAVAARAAH